MLLSFHVKNYKSIIDTSLSLEWKGKRVPSGYRNFNTLILIEEGRYRALPLIAIYGANSSGKSTILSALNTLKELIEKGPSKSLFFPNKFVDIKNSEFGLSFVIKNKKYDYLISYNDLSIEREELREGERIILSSSGAKKTSLTQPFVSYLLSFHFFQSFSYSLHDEFNKYVSSLKGKREEALERVIELAKKLDLTINNLFEEKDGWLTEHLDNSDKSYLFSLDEESEGTRRLLALLSAFLTTLEKGGVLIVDEIDISLHSAVLSTIVSLFLDRRYNKRNAQLICSLHNTDLMEAPSVTSNEIAIFEKTKKNGSLLTPLSSLTEEKDTKKIRRLYLEGRLTGVPFPYI